MADPRKNVIPAEQLQSQNGSTNHGFGWYINSNSSDLSEIWELDYDGNTLKHSAVTTAFQGVVRWMHANVLFLRF